MSRLARWLLFVLISGALALALAGRTDLPRLWAYLGVIWAVMLLGIVIVDAEVARERLKKGQKTADPVVLLLIRALSFATIIAGVLDVGRLHWSDTVAPGVSAVALAAMGAAFGVTLWAVAANRFFVPAVRIQSERGHRVVDGGPYRWLRHPGYAGMAVALPASGLALGSWLAFAVGLAGALAFAFRAAREDRFLQANLEGYGDYAARTRFRVIPGVW